MSSFTAFTPVDPKYNPNLPKMPLQSEFGKNDYAPFWEFRQPWRSTYHESQGVAKHKVNKSAQDLARIDREYANIQPILNRALNENAETYMDLVASQEAEMFYNGYAGMGEGSFFPGVRFTNHYNNQISEQYSKYVKINEMNPAYIGVNGVPDTRLIANTFRPCAERDGKFYFSDVMPPQLVFTGLYCSPKNGYLSMPINRRHPNLDSSFGLIFDEDSRIAHKPFPEIVKVVQKVLSKINVEGFSTHNEVLMFKANLEQNVINPITKVFVRSLVIYSNGNKYYLLPNMPY